MGVLGGLEGFGPCQDPGWAQLVLVGTRTLRSLCILSDGAKEMLEELSAVVQAEGCVLV